MPLGLRPPVQEPAPPTRNNEAAMHKLLFVLIVLLATPLLAEDKNVKENNTFEEKGKFSVDVPEKGFEWKKLQDLKFTNTPDAKIIGAGYICEKKDSTKTAVLTAHYRKIKTDKERKEYIEGYLDGVRKKQENLSGKILDGDKPKIEGKISNQVSYLLKAQNADGSIIYVQTTLVFGKNTFSISTIGSTANEAKKTSDKIVESFKELEK
ncbi:MAG: hypothetical protein IT426_10800 [Pirellulales bacterium]|nr:hypothetical protein [Pirellulales bacterium]